MNNGTAAVQFAMKCERIDGGALLQDRPRYWIVHRRPAWNRDAENKARTGSVNALRIHAGCKINKSTCVVNESDCWCLVTLFEGDIYLFLLHKSLHFNPLSRVFVFSNRTSAWNLILCVRLLHPGVWTFPRSRCGLFACETKRHSR